MWYTGSMQETYTVQLATFEGPLDLLLSFIEKEQLSITEISLASIADQYLGYMETRQDIPLEDLASFLSVAAKLILIKSRALLPILTFTESEEEAIIDLQLQLELYATFKQAAENLRGVMAAEKTLGVRESYLGVTELYYPPKDVTKEVLHETLLGFLGGLEKEVVLPQETLRKIVSLERRITEVQETIAKRGTMLFQEMMAKGQKEDVIVSFLALLELIKQKFVRVEQGALFTDITIHKV